MQLRNAKPPVPDLRTQRLPDKMPFVAVVRSVKDGDTIAVERVYVHELLPRIEYIRLAGIDAPELGGVEDLRARRSREALLALVDDLEVTILPARRWRDPYSRIIARVYLGSLDVNHWMILQGHANPLRRGVYKPADFIV